MMEKLRVSSTDMVIGWREFNREGKKMRRVLTRYSAREIEGNQGKGKGESRWLG